MSLMPSKCLWFRPEIHYNYDFLIPSNLLYTSATVPWHLSTDVSLSVPYSRPFSLNSPFFFLYFVRTSDGGRSNIINAERVRWTLSTNFIRLLFFRASHHTRPPYLLNLSSTFLSQWSFCLKYCFLYLLVKMTSSVFLPDPQFFQCSFHKISDSWQMHSCNFISLMTTPSE